MLKGISRKFPNKLIVSCQDNPEWTIRMAVKGKCGGLRVDGISSIKLARSVAPDLPIIGSWKHHVRDSSVYITPMVEHAEAVAWAGADMVAFDATRCKNRMPVVDILAAIHRGGVPAVADVGCVEDGFHAWKCGAEYVATTMSQRLDVKLILELIEKCKCPIIVEGHVRTPEQAAWCLSLGADLVVVGSAITRPHLITEWFVEAVKGVS